MSSNDLTQKKLIKYICEKCLFNTCNRNDYYRHTLTKKHLINESQYFSINNTQKNAYECKCGKIYKDYSGLWRHKKTCNCNNKEKEEKELSENIQNNEMQELKEIMKYLMKENSEMKNLILEVIKNGTHNTTNTHTNSHNKTFNLQFFLNETCKDAMNIMEFVDSVNLQLSDFENVGKLGYIDGISNIIIKNLNALDVTQRPVHCADSKREIIYIKDDNKWEREDESKRKIRKVIKRVADKNARLILKFREKYPDYNKATSLVSDQYNKLIIEAMGGLGDNDLEKEDKIIKNLVKQVVIDKDKYSN
jgi:hypothetical protein